MRLKGGIPLSSAAVVKNSTFRAAAVEAAIVPGVTAALGCAAEAGLPLTYREEASRLTFITAYRAAEAAATDWSGLADPQTTVVVYMGLSAAATVRDGLIAAGAIRKRPLPCWRAAPVRI